MQSLAEFLIVPSKSIADLVIQPVIEVRVCWGTLVLIQVVPRVLAVKTQSSVNILNLT